jgi:protein TonB
MLAYAASRPAPIERRPSPNAMLGIIAVHVAALAVLMSAKMDLPIPIPRPPTHVFWVDPPKDPPPPKPIQTPSPPQPTQTTFSNPEPLRPMPLPQDPLVATGPIAANPGPVVTGGSAAIIPLIRPQPRYPVKLGAQLATPASELKPPYPASKLLSEEEAVLRLKLTIDERGRVVAVEPVGRADPAFVSAARRHLIAHWRYRPASEDGRPTPSTEVITLRFQLDG